MPSYRRVLDIYQGYNFKKDKQVPVGFITKMKVADQELAVDQTSKDPTAPQTDLQCMAIMDDVQWDVGLTDAVYMSGRLSAVNRQTIATLLYNDLTNVEVVFQFSVYD